MKNEFGCSGISHLSRIFVELEAVISSLVIFSGIAVVSEKNFGHDEKQSVKSYEQIRNIIEYIKLGFIGPKMKTPFGLEKFFDSRTRLKLSREL